MNALATQRKFLIDVAKATFGALQGEPSVLETAGDAQPDAVEHLLEAALEWARLEGASMGAEALEEVSAAEPYMPYNQTLSLLQSACEEYAKGGASLEVPFDANDPGWKEIAKQKLKAASLPKHAFAEHTSVTDFTYDLPEDAVVALFADWGTGEPTAQRVMQQIKACQPTHAIHLGDVYYAGTPEESREHFLDIIDKHGPSKQSCQYFALPGNHDYYSGGYGYFDGILAAIGQEASYFNLRNSKWQLIGLDSAYDEYALHEPQLEWLKAQVEGAGKPILLSHHQAFSPYDHRVTKSQLLKKTEALLPRVFAWFWGHEHRCVIMADHLGIKARCIGHGGIPSIVPYGAPIFPDVPVTKVDERAAPDTEGTCYHGFALLRFKGGSVDVSYIDEYGNPFYEEPFE
ncbi:MAG: metallophosphoesterase [Nitrospira sp.]|nr:metallophosphoesterase [Nitrospira sp.]